MRLADGGDVRQSRGDGPFNSSMKALQSMPAWFMVRRHPPAMLTDAPPYMRITMSIHNQNCPTTAGVPSWDTLVSRTRGVEERLRSLDLDAMPRSRGVPRRGGRSGIRVAPDIAELHSISPMASAPPSSPSSEQESLVPQGTYQTFRLRFPSRLIRPEVVTNLTIYISEEEPGDHTSISPASASVQDSEILLGDMNGLVYKAHRNGEPSAQHALVQEAAAQEVSGQAVSVQEVLPPHNSVMEREAHGGHAQPSLGESFLDGEGLVIWLDSPSPDKGTQPASPSRPA